MSGKDYWIQRAAWRMYEAMESAEHSADDIAEVYWKSSQYLSQKASEIFETFRRRYGLTEEEAKRILARVHDKRSLEELLRALQNSEISSKEEVLREWESAAYRARIERLGKLQREIDLVVRNVYQQEMKISTEFYRKLARDSYYKEIFDIQQRAGVSFSFAHISTKQIDQVLAMDWSGKNYSKRIWKNTGDLAEQLRETLLINLLTGRTDREAAEEITHRFAVGASKARRLIRTESNFVSSEINAAAYRAARIEEYQFLATLDLRTSKICQALDGKIFLVSERQVGVNCNPMHPWCRSTTISVVDRKYIAKMTRSARDPVTGKVYKVPRSMNYASWYDKYVKSNQDALREEKKIKNRSSDRRQHEKYRRILGDNIPEKLDDFQDLKYTEPEKWEEIKSSARRFGTASGARNPYGEAAGEHAERYYGLVRSMKTDVSRIAKATGYPEEEIQRIKDYIFLDKHDLGGSEPEYFAPDYMMGESWRRLIDGKPEPHDLTLLKHEMMERDLMQQGYGQHEAHIKTSKKYDYDTEATQFYDKIKKYKKE